MAQRTTLFVLALANIFKIIPKGNALNYEIRTGKYVNIGTGIYVYPTGTEGNTIDRMVAYF